MPDDISEEIDMTETETLEQSTELTIPQGNQLVAAFASPKAMDDILARIETDALAVAPDTSTVKGRKSIASMAYKVAQSKSALDKAGKDLNEEHRAAINAVDAERRKIRERLDAIKVKVRAPLDEWEAAEESRVEGLKTRLAAIDSGRADAMSPSAQIKGVIAEIEGMAIDDSWQEFKADAALAKDRALTKLRADLVVAEQREAEQAELERLRREAAEREEADRKRREAEEAEARRVAAEKAEAERQERIEREKKEAAERAAREAEERAKKAAAEAEERHRREISEAKAREERATQAERDRIEAERRAEDEARAKREASKARRRKVREAIIGGIREAGTDPETIADALMTGSVPHIKVEF